LEQLDEGLARVELFARARPPATARHASNRCAGLPLRLALFEPLFLLPPLLVAFFAIVIAPREPKPCHPQLTPRSCGSVPVASTALLY
jgi:hypothetical protein